MKGKMTIYYDEQGDFLEINAGEYTKGYFKDLGDGVAERIDEKTGEITGVAIIGFKKRTAKLKDLKMHLPLKVELSI